MKSANGLIGFGLGIFGVSLWAGLLEIAVAALAMMSTVVIVEYMQSEG